jgi:trimethylamine--corrinoid protein Co-methyltransferase
MKNQIGRWRKEVRIGEDYLTHSSTLERYRTEYFLTDLLNRRDYVEWKLAGKKRLDDRAREAVTKRLAVYKKPEIDPHIERALADYVDMMKNR